MSAANDLLLDALGRVRESVPAVVDGLTDDQLTQAPAPGGNPVGWLVWHLSRVLDDHLAAASGDEQVWVTQGFAEQFALDLPTRDTGFGHSADQVARVRAPAALLADYHEAVQDHYEPYLRDVADFDRIVDTRWDPPVTLSARLVSLVDECARHVGQAEYVRGLVG